MSSGTRIRQLLVLEAQVEFLLLALVLLAVPFVLPIATWVSVRRTRGRVVDLEELADHLIGRIRELESSLQALRTERRVQMPAERSEEAAAAPAPPEDYEPAAPSPEPTVEPVEAESGPPAAPQPEPRPEPAVAAKISEEPQPVLLAAAQDAEPPPTEMAEEVVGTPVARRDAAPAQPGARVPAFDWEGLVGIKLFSAIAGVALVVAAILFLRYSIEHGWLQPPVRVAIGIVVAVGLLVLCELKAARRYPVTANALDAAAIAILFATFFAAHALWDLIPGSVAFGLLALVTALAVLLAIRRESRFIAVLGLLGGFSTPALLSTGENRPIPLFAYLLLLNIGLAWVAQQRGWGLLSWLTLVFTTIYQWGWVIRFLHESSLSLAMGVFIIFPVVSMAALAVARRSGAGSGSADDGGLERTGLVSAILPLAFVTYLAAVPEYGSRSGLLLGFLLIVDLGLLAVAIVRREHWPHGVGAVATLLTMGVWLAVSYPGSEARLVALGSTAAASLLYLLAPLLAARVGRSFERSGAATQLAAPLLLFGLPVLARIEPTFATPWLLVATLLLLVCAIAWTAIGSGAGALYYVAAFFAVATQATWSSTHLSSERLASAVAIYSIFAAVSLGVPILARRRGRPLAPAWGGGVVLILSLALLLFLSAGPIAPSALWALALLLAILNAAIFVEGAAGGIPWLTQAGTVLSWIVLANWWSRAAGAVGVLPSLAVLTGLTLVTLGGHAWTVRRAAADATSTPSGAFARGLYLGLTGHLFLLFLALNREWAMPPWPLFATLVVITLAVSTASLGVRAPALHVAGAIAAAIVVSAWGTAAGEPPWPTVALLASAAMSLYALGWIVVTRRLHERASAACAGAVLVISEIALILMVDVGTPLPFPGVLGLHVGNMAVLLALASRYSWRLVVGGASGLAWVAVLHWQAIRISRPTGAMDGDLWPNLLLLAAALYAIFIVYPMIVGRRRAHDREPYVAAIVASAMLFFAARPSLRQGGLEWVLGAVPVLEGALLTVLLRQILRLEPAGERDLGRLALVAGAALAFVTVAIPVQLERQWITIGWALEGAALAWLYRRVPHKGLLAASLGLLAVVFVRLALNPEVFTYEPRGALPVLNWYLYTYSISAACMFIAARWLSTTDETVWSGWITPSKTLPVFAVVLLFLLLNIEITDYFATGPALTFRFGVTVSQDLTYTLGWLVFGMALLAAGIYQGSRGARIAALGLIVVTTFKCFLYDLGSLEGLYRVASFVGLAVSLALVALALQKYATDKHR